MYSISKSQSKFSKKKKMGIMRNGVWMEGKRELFILNDNCGSSK